MKAAVFTNGRAVTVREIAQPEPGPGEVLVRVRAAGICGSDLHSWRSGELWFPEAAPLIPGHEIAGDVVACGKNVDILKAGDRVAVQPMITCGTCRVCREGSFQLCPSIHHVGFWFPGGFADYVVVPQANAYLIPDTLSYEIASLADVYACGLHAVHRLSIASGQSVAIIGTGPIALASGQLVRRLCSSRVLMVGRRQTILEAAVGCGAADEVLNIGRVDPAEGMPSMTNGAVADLVIEAVGGTRTETLALAFHLAAPNGRVGVLGEFLGTGLVPLQRGMEKQLDLSWVTGYGDWRGRSEFRDTLDLLAAGGVQAASLITHRFPLARIADAFVSADSKSASGAIKVLIMPE